MSIFSVISSFEIQRESQKEIIAHTNPKLKKTISILSSKLLGRSKKRSAKKR